MQVAARILCDLLDIRDRGSVRVLSAQYLQLDLIYLTGFCGDYRIQMVFHFFLWASKRLSQMVL